MLIGRGKYQYTTYDGTPRDVILFKSDYAFIVCFQLSTNAWTLDAVVVWCESATAVCCADDVVLAWLVCLA